jgi:hypothetical protein
MSLLKERIPPSPAPVRQKPMPDDVALFADDTIDGAVAVRMGASPSGVVMLSPARHGLAARALSAPTRSTPGSAKRPPAKAFADVTNTPVSQGTKKRLFDPHVPSLGTTPAAQRSNVSLASFCHVATSPFAGQAAEPAMPVEAETTTTAFLKLQREHDRLLKMYDHVCHRAVDTEAARADAQEKLDAKITDVVSLTSRLEEAKRFTKQLKAELRDSKARALPHHNAPFSDTARIEKKFQELLRSEAEAFQHAVQLEADRAQQLEDALDALDVAPSATDALLAAFRARRQAEADLDEMMKAKDDAEDRWAARVRDMAAELTATRRAASSETRRLRRRLQEHEDYIARLETAVTAKNDRGHDCSCGGGEEYDAPCNLSDTMPRAAGELEDDTQQEEYADATE